jgi:hypothetical protein
MRIALHLLAFPVLIFVTVAGVQLLLGLPTLLSAQGTWWIFPLSMTAFFLWLMICAAGLVGLAVSMVLSVDRRRK